MNRLQRSHNPTADSVLDRVKYVLRKIQRQEEVGALDVNSANKDLDALLTNLARLEDSPEIPADLLKKSIQSVTEVKANLPNTEQQKIEAKRYDSTLPNPHGKGRNQCDIDIVKLQQLINMGFTVKKIAEDGLLGGVLHPNTLYKRLKDHDIQIKSTYSNISDDDLTACVIDYNKEHPNAGALEVQAYLKTKGINVQRQRCRDTLSTVDATGTAMRWSNTIQRREYSVPTANSVWHVDTHHSLIRWGIVIHGGIDGHSRLISFLRAANYNTAKAAACFFFLAIKSFGVPSRVRADHGTEYVDVGRFITAINGDDRGSFLTGPSVHNQRIERLWRDVFCKVIDTYYKLFCFMEERRIYDQQDKIHRWALQFVFTKRIDQALQEWMNTHNSHKVRTEKNQTPSMMWFQSLLQGDSNKYTSVRNAESPPDEDIEKAASDINIERDDATFHQPREPCPLSAENLQLLKQSVDILKKSSSHGLDIFATVVEFVKQNTAM